MIQILLPTKRQCRALIFPLPLLVVFGYYPIFHNHAHSVLHHCGMFALAILTTFACWLFALLANNCISYKISHPEKMFIRGASIFILILITVAIMLLAIIYLADQKLALIKLMSMDSLLACVILIFGTNILLCSIWQTDLILEQLKKDLMDRDVMEKQLLNAQYNRLKQQINPGFLFNNFTILSSLILENPSQAINYLDNLSKVYRYLLKQEDSGFSMLKSELGFLKAYELLLMERYQGSVRVKVDETLTTNNHYLPTLSLQLLIENAIKHNRCSSYEPLEIEILQVGDTAISLRNNLQLRNNPIGLHSEGLREIKARYRDSGFPEVQIKNNGNQFSVMLPLLRFIKTNDP